MAPFGGSSMTRDLADELESFLWTATARNVIFFTHQCAAECDAPNASPAREPARARRRGL